MFKVDLVIKAEQLQIDLKQMEQNTRELLEAAVADVAKNTYAEAIRLAQAKLKTSKADYIKSLDLETVGENSYLLSLNGKMANMIETGFGSYDMKPGLLNGPNSKVTKKGVRYNTVPFSYNPFGKSPLSEKGEQLRSQVMQLIKQEGIKKTIVDPNTGRPVQGRAATVKNTDVKNLVGLVKYQFTNPGSKRTSSQYMTFRRVTSNSPATSWIHPGYKGAHIFPVLRDYAERAIEQILYNNFSNQLLINSMNFI